MLQLLSMLDHFRFLYHIQTDREPIGGCTLADKYGSLEMAAAGICKFLQRTGPTDRGRQSSLAERWSGWRLMEWA